MINIFFSNFKKIKNKIIKRSYKLEPNKIFKYQLYFKSFFCYKCFPFWISILFLINSSSKGFNESYSLNTQYTDVQQDLY